MAALPEEMAYVTIVVEHVQLINNPSQVSNYLIGGAYHWIEIQLRGPVGQYIGNF